MDDWLRLVKESLTTADDLSLHFPGVDTGEAKQVIGKYPMRINSYFMDVIRNSDSPAIYRQAVPDIAELRDTVCMEDPLSEEQQSPVPNLTHRYPDRCLFLVSSQCAMYCRFCTRKRKVGDPQMISADTIKAGIEYIKNHSEIRDVILSGGDPLMLADEVLEDIVGNVRKIPHVEIIRIGTRVPCALPMRVTQRLCRMLKKHHPIFINVHFNHPDELTPEAREACGRLVDSGFPVNNQSVLLRGVNDSPEILTKLFQQLLACRVRPYYLYQADVTKGTNHFRTPMERGLDIIRGLRGYTSGLAVPHFVIDAPQGGGKIPLLPKYVTRRTNKEIIMRNYKGEIYRYPEVQHEELDVKVVENTEVLK
ncbi:MAG: KamA family radical SAM protein [Planctomycetes bacterium]|nr:KamA family radical SAM protein [Planctomycetota bacterium]